MDRLAVLAAAKARARLDKGDDPLATLSAAFDGVQTLAAALTEHGESDLEEQGLLLAGGVIVITETMILLEMHGMDCRTGLEELMNKLDEPKKPNLKLV